MIGAVLSDPPMPIRKCRKGPEADLVDAVLLHGLPETYGHRPLLLREPELPTGYPDLVAVFLRRASCRNLTPARLAFTANHIRLIHHLYCVRGSAITEMSRALSWSQRKLQGVVDDLRTAGIARKAGERIALKRPRLLFGVSRIVAIEAKIRDWKRAIDQATANTWFASHSYVLLPPKRRLGALVTRARHLGIGVMISDGEECKVVLKAKRQPIPASYGSWLLSEWVFRHINRGSKHADTR